MLKLKDGTEAEIGMIISDADGVYRITDIDESRSLCEVKELYVDESGSTWPMGDWFLLTFGEVRKCERW